MSFFDRVKDFANAATDKVNTIDIVTKGELIAASLVGLGAIALTVAANQVDTDYLIEDSDILELDPSDVEIQTVTDQEGE